MRTAHSVIFRAMLYAAALGLFGAWAPAETGHETAEAEKKSQDHVHSHPESPDGALGLIEGRHHLDGITAAGYWLMKHGFEDKALEVLEKGTKDNPDSFQIYAVLGQLHFRNARSEVGDDNGTQSWDSARLAYTRATELGLEQFAATKPSAWTEYLDKDLRGAARMAVLIDLRKGDPVRGRALAEKALKQLGSDPPLERAVTPE